MTPKWGSGKKVCPSNEGCDVPPPNGIGEMMYPLKGVWGGGVSPKWGVWRRCAPPKWDWGGDVPTQKVRQGGGVPPKWD